MKTKIAVLELRKGMYVSELDRPWVGTPFLFQGFEIHTDEELEQLRKLCEFVYIDTDLERTGAARPAAPAVRTPTTVVTEIRTARLHADTPDQSDILKQTLNSRRAPPRYSDLATLEEELGTARDLESSTRELAYTIMDDVRLGRAINSARAKQLVAGMVQSIVRNPDALVWLTQLKNKNEYTALHSLRVCILALAFGRHLDLTADQLNVLGTGALLHDIGKLKVPNEILDKPGRLTDDEYRIMKKHVPMGVEILESTSGIPGAAIDVARCHHERYSGAGYVNGITGDQIGLFGLIGAIVDCYDAITSDRAYHSGLSAYDALKKLYEERDKDFHGGLVEQFIQCMGIYPIGSIVEMSTGSVGVVITVNRERRLRPKVALVLDSQKHPYPVVTVLDLFQTMRDNSGTVLEIRRVLPAGSFGISANTYLPTGS